MSPDPLRIDFPGLEPSESEAGRKARGRRRAGSLLRPRRLLGFLAAAVMALVFPFFLLVRLAVFLLHRHELGSWTALACAAAATCLLLILYLVLASIRMGRKGRVPGFLWKGTVAVVVAYCLYALMVVHGANVKSTEVRATFTTLNPILRVGVSTLLLADREAVLTGAARDREDYGSWGLDVNEASLHLQQSDGYAYAVDLRTLGRPAWRNGLVELYFRVMGFRTLRHVGTADHLHVSLRPNARVR